MRRLLACLTLVSIGMFATATFAGAAVTPKAKSTTIRVYGVNGYSNFITAAGKPIGENAAPVPGDQLLQSVNLYHGSNSHHAKGFFATASLHCLITAVSQTSVPASCEVVVAIGGSEIISLSVQNFATSPPAMVFPVVTGTGVFNEATGRIVVVNLGNPNNSTTSNALIQVTTP